MIKDLFYKAGKLENAKRAEAEKEKIGILRGGTTGAIAEDGEVIGKCHRKALVRYLGLDKAEGGNLFFDMGLANEDLWVNKLKQSWHGTIKCEEEIPIKWELDGVAITGRPDVVLFEDDKPVAGIELKSIGAINTAAQILYDNKPKLDNLLQAANYSMNLNIPFYLVYTSFVQGDLPYWAQKQYLEKKVTPFIKEFKVWVDDRGTICYQTDKGKVVKTIASWSGISDFYKLIIAMPKEKTLYSRFKDKRIDGKPLPYDPCGYCPYQETCDRYEDDYDSWIDAIKVIKNRSQEET